MIIKKYTYRVNCTISIAVLAEREPDARKILDRSVEKGAKVVLVSEEFSHNSDDYKVERKPISNKAVAKWGEEKTGIDSVIDVFGKRMGKMSL